MSRSLKLEAYIKKYTGIHITVYLVTEIKGGYGSVIRPYNRDMKIINSVKHFKPLIWHEMGHLITDEQIEKDWCLKEYKAQQWAFERLKKLKYYKLYNQSVDWVSDWDEIENDNTASYGIVKRMLSKYLTHIH